ncbi:MAG: hypothetical protein KC646_18290, partial [Candidatus Cloacimonetes bacterium]|nr:hypothetical protein [Candidatus Cloacimonadota bacterium]
MSILFRTCNFRKKCLYFIFNLVLLLPLAIPINSLASDERRLAENLTQSLHALNLAYQHAEPNASDKALEQLRSVALKRHDFLLNLVQDNPAIVLDASLSEQDRAAMPDAIQEFIEYEAEFEGKLKVLYADYEDSQAQLRHYLETIDTKNRVSLHFEMSSSDLLTDQQLIAKGLFFQDHKRRNGTMGAMAIESYEPIETLALGGNGTEGTSGEQNSVGEQSVAVILVNFQNNPDEPISLNDAHDLVFNQTNSFMLETSF